MAKDNKRGTGRGRVTIKMDPPAATVETLEKHGIKIEARGADRKVFLDQSSGMAEVDGCYNNPGGPSC